MVVWRSAHNLKYVAWLWGKSMEYLTAGGSIGSVQIVYDCRPHMTIALIAGSLVCILYTISCCFH